MSSPLTLAFLTPTISGHANVHLATIHALYVRSTEASLPISVHVLGDEPLRARIAALPTSALFAVTFHALHDADTLQDVARDLGAQRLPPLSLSLSAVRAILASNARWLYSRPDVYLARYARALDVVARVQPDLFVTDIMAPCAGLCRDLRARTPTRFVLLIPTQSLDLALFAQPRGAAFWRFPMLYTERAYPLRLLDVPANALLMLAFLIFIATCTARGALDRARRAVGLHGSALAPPWDGAECVVCPSLRALEYAHEPLPRTVFAGPILAPEAVVSARDHPALARFLDRGRAAVVNLGSMFAYTPDDVRGIADAIVAAQRRLHEDGRGSVRVLWKLPRADEHTELLDELLGLKREDVLIQQWIDAPALAVLQHPNVAVFVHHGGANSMHEALYAGVPQIVLPQWYDLYPLAVRTEALGHGIYANKGAPMRIDGPQLANALLRVLCDAPGEEGAALKTRAAELATLCRRERGDLRAADAMLAAARGMAVPCG